MSVELKNNFKPLESYDVDAVVKVQAHTRGYLSRKREAKIITEILTHNDGGIPTAKLTTFIGKLGYIIDNEKDKNIKSAFTVASIDKEHANLKVMSQGTGLFLPSELDTASGSEGYKGAVMINGGFFEMLKGGTKDEGKCYGVKAGTPIGPTKTITHDEGERGPSDKKQKGHNTVEKLIEDKQGIKTYHGLGDKDYQLNQGTLIPQAYEGKYGTLVVSSGEMEIVPYLKLKQIDDVEISSLAKKIDCCVSTAPILVKNDKELITYQELTQDIYQFPKDGICGPGQLLHGSTANPRSAIGYNDKEIKALYVVGINHGVGYKIDEVRGLTLAQLARLVHRLGMENALNLDGGGSCFLIAQTETGEQIDDFQGKRELSNYIRIDIV